jgi:TrkA-C domain
VYAIGSLLLIIAVSLVVTRVATVVLTATGLSREVARFQARSAFTGAGFTTSESEEIVGHPLRRRVVMGLMLLGNAGIVASVGSLMVGFTRGHSGNDELIKIGELATGLLAIVWISRSSIVDRRLNELIRLALHNWTDVETRDRADLLELADDYAVTELVVADGEWVASRTLADLSLRDEGIAVLGVTRGGVYTGTPKGDTCVEPGDTLVLYGLGEALAELDCRPAGAEGERRHAIAVTRQAGR